jgi:hypothetical protein
VVEGRGHGFDGRKTHTPHPRRFGAEPKRPFSRTSPNKSPELFCRRPSGRTSTGVKRPRARFSLWNHRNRGGSLTDQLAACKHQRPTVQRSHALRARPVVLRLRDLLG